MRKAWKPSSSRPSLIYFEFRSKPSLITVISMDPRPTNYLRQNIVFPYPEMIRVSFSLFLSLSVFCYFTLLLIQKTGVFTSKWRLRRERASPDIPYRWRVTTQIWVVLLTGWKFALSNQKAYHYPDLGNDTWSAWNFSARFSDVISRGNKWWRREMSAVLSGYFIFFWSWLIPFSFQTGQFHKRLIGLQLTIFNWFSFSLSWFAQEKTERLC